MNDDLDSFVVFESSNQKTTPRIIIEKMRFLISVKHDDHIFQRCAVTAKTPALVPETKLNKTNRINVSECDNGKFLFALKRPSNSSDPKVTYVVNVQFYSFYLDNPVACSIPWNVSYRLPTGPSFSSLPGCFARIVQLVDNALYMEHNFYFKIYDWIG
ncbi:uncharacterized protein LOC133184015 [Saccostrea echinata]|uniref:uncharacterized protein LOC133184015 n=1 Tax=Saccostrea echinata TaxID=191078 RepID=UPI002A836B9A|nr:uncharacterized protein LOC133184015 [Saccostrea echinata]